MSKTEEEFKKLLFDEIHIQPNTYDIDTKQLCDDVVQELKSQGFFISQWRPIEEAPKDGTPFLIKLKDQLPEGFLEKDRFEGISFVARHTGLADDGFDIGWQFAAPVGMGGFTDDYIAGFMPLPPSPEGEE